MTATVSSSDQYAQPNGFFSDAHMFKQRRWCSILKTKAILALALACLMLFYAGCHRRQEEDLKELISRAKQTVSNASSYQIEYIVSLELRSAGQTRRYSSRSVTTVLSHPARSYQRVITRTDQGAEILERCVLPAENGAQLYESRNGGGCSVTPLSGESAMLVRQLTAEPLSFLFYADRISPSGKGDTAKARRLSLRLNAEALRPVAEQLLALCGVPATRSLSDGFDLPCPVFADCALAREDCCILSLSCDAAAALNAAVRRLTEGGLGPVSVSRCHIEISVDELDETDGFPLPDVLPPVPANKP